MRSVVDWHFSSEIVLAQVSEFNTEVSHHCVGRQVVELLQCNTPCEKRRAGRQVIYYLGYFCARPAKREPKIELCICSGTWAN